MTFYPQHDTLEVSNITDEHVEFTVRGTVTVRDGKYTNEKNGTETFTVSHDTARGILADLEGGLPDQ